MLFDTFAVVCEVLFAVLHSWTCLFSSTCIGTTDDKSFVFSYTKVFLFFLVLFLCILICSW